MTLRNPSRRVAKRQRGIGSALSRFSTATKTKFFAAALLPRALTLSLNLAPVAEMPIVVAEPTAVETSIVFDASSPLALNTKFEAISINKQPSRLQEEATAARRGSSTRTVAYSAPRIREGEPDILAKRSLAQVVADKYGIDWRLLEAVWQVESGKSWHTGVQSYAGAQGPMQFMPGTWRRYGVDGDGDGQADATNVYDALHGGARYLAANGAADGNVDRALYAYNHAGWYVEKVKTVMNSI